MKRILLIDFYNLLHRAYHAFPRELKNSKGVQTNAIFGFLNTVLSLIKELEPTNVLSAYETGPSFRKVDFEKYKINRVWRKEHPEEAAELENQVGPTINILAAMGIPSVDSEGYEADDILGTLAKKFSKEGCEVIIVTNDMDALQVVSEFVKVYRPARPPFLKKRIYSKREVLQEFGFWPEKIPDYKALRGDASDNIPGVKGIGDKTAKKLITQYNDIENIYKNIDNISPKSLREKLINGRESAFLSKKLATMIVNIPISVNLEEANIKNIDNENVKKLFEEYEFNSLLKKVSSTAPLPTKKGVIDETQITLGI